MTVDETATRIMVFLSEDDRLQHRGLHEVVVERARDAGLDGATVWRGIEGFGPGGHVRTSRFLDANTGMPMVVELIGDPASIESFLDELHQLVPGSLVTREEIRLVRPEAPDESR